MFSEAIAEIKEIITTEEAYLNSLNKEAIVPKFNTQNRSIKQILGHLIDSASNNLHRIIHLQYNEIPLNFPNYATNGNNDRWIAIQNFQGEDWLTLVQLWKYSNLHLIHVIESVNADKLENRWIASETETVSLKEMIINYPPHLRLHIDQIHELYDRQ